MVPTPIAAVAGVIDSNARIPATIDACRNLRVRSLPAMLAQEFFTMMSLGGRPDRAGGSCFDG